MAKVECQRCLKSYGENGFSVHSCIAASLVKIEITGPGCNGSLEKRMPQSDIRFLISFAKEWNEANTAHSQPSIKVITKR